MGKYIKSSIKLKFNRKNTAAAIQTCSLIYCSCPINHQNLCKINEKGFIFLYRWRLEARSFVFSYFRFSYTYFSEQLLMVSEHWGTKYFTLAYHTNLSSFFLFPTISTIRLLLICVSFNFVQFSHVKLVLSTSLTMFQECFFMLQNDLVKRLLLSALNHHLNSWQRKCT